MTQETFRRTFLTVLYLLCIPVTFFLARLVSQQSVQVTESARAVTAVSSGAFEVTLTAQDMQTGDIRIPLPADVTREQVVFENRYLEHALYITIDTRQRGFYVDHAVLCDTKKTGGITCFLHDNDTIGLRIKTASLYDPSFRVENGALNVFLSAPGENAEHVIVLDPVYGGTGSDVSLALATRLQNELLSSPLSCRVYLTRTDAQSASDEAVASLIKESGASRYLRLSMPEGEAALSASLSFTDSFFIRGYGNAPFAADVMRALSAVNTLHAGDIRTVSDDARLADIRIPALSVHIEGVRSSLGGDETVLTELSRALCTALRIGFSAT